MATRKLPLIGVGDQLYLDEGELPFGAVREVAPGGEPQLRIHIENGGDFMVGLNAVRAVHYGKVILEKSHLPSALRQAIRHAHDGESPGL